MSSSETAASPSIYAVNESHEIDNLPEADREEKHRLIKQVLELQHTLADLCQRVDSIRQKNVTLRSQNQILGQYVEKLMATSSVFQSSSSSSSSTHQASSGYGGLRSEHSSSMSSSTVAAARRGPKPGTKAEGFQYDDETCEFGSDDDELA